MSGFTGVPQPVWDALQDEVDKQELDYADNYRAYREADSKFLEAFQEAERDGCCGFFEGSTLVEGETWIIGCNYGH